MLAATALHRFTAAELRAMAEAGLIDGDARVELIDGLIVDMSPIGRDHAYLVDVVMRLYGRHRPDEPTDAPFARIQQPVEVGLRDQLVPDISVVRGPVRRYRDHLPRADEVLEIVEIADATLARDTTEKLAIYQRAAIPSILVVDVPGRRIHRWTADSSAPGGYVGAILAGQDEWLAGTTVDDLFT